MSTVIEFHRPEQRPVAALKVAEQQAPPRLADIKDRLEWKNALAAIWANPKNWKRSKKGNAYIAIDDICIVITNDENGYYLWEIRWRYRTETTVSRWVYIREQTAIDEAFDAVLALG